MKRKLYYRCDLENPCDQHVHNLDKSYTMRHRVCSLQWVTTHTYTVNYRETETDIERERERERVTTTSLSSLHQPPALPWPYDLDTVIWREFWYCDRCSFMLHYMALHYNAFTLNCIAPALWLKWVPCRWWSINKRVQGLRCWLRSWNLNTLNMRPLT